MQPVNEFFRNKPVDYFNYIVNHRRNVMEVYLKDNNGHRGNPINNRLDGLFFSVDPTPTIHSFFGNCRLFVPSSVLFNESNSLYFADFYCNNVAHYITLVITKPHTEADAFSRKYLRKLDMGNNPFLTLMIHPITRVKCAYVAHLKKSYHIEVFYTESLNISNLLAKGSRFSMVHSSGSSKPGGILRNKTCAICDI